MRHRVVFHLCWSLIICMLLLQGLQAAQMEDREYKIKAAFLYNFLKAIEWPEQQHPANNAPYVIGILGDSPFGNSFDPIHDRTVRGHTVKVIDIPHQQHEDPTTQTEATAQMRSCHILFICSSEHDHMDELLSLVKGYAVLTVAESDSFLSLGGMINFLPYAKKGEFEINLSASQEAGLQMSSKLLHIAKKVVNNKESN